MDSISEKENSAGSGRRFHLCWSEVALAFASQNQYAIDWSPFDGKSERKIAMCVVQNPRSCGTDIPTGVALIRFFKHKNGSSLVGIIESFIINIIYKNT
jgi:hypothetical protein